LRIIKWSIFRNNYLCSECLQICTIHLPIFFDFMQKLASVLYSARLFPKFSLVLFLLLYSLKSQAQGSISGQVVDSLSGKPIDYSSIGLILQENNKEVNGTTTDDKGLFSLGNIPYGTYKIVVYYIGYKTGTKSNIEISKTNTSVNLGNILLAGNQINLQEVMIVSNTPVIENKIDKVVYNAENDITSQGGAAIDVLKKVPQVTVDVDGNVELQGNPNIRFLINGKPSSMFGNSLADALASIPASQIKSIEAITSPGAKYDAQGTGGIINIILKQNKVKGINGSINLSAGTRFETGAFNLNFRNNNFGANVFFSGNAQLSSHTPNSQKRSSTDTATQTSSRLLQDGYTDVQRQGFRSGVGFEWNINPKNSFTGSVAYNQFASQNKSLINQEQITQDNSSAVIQDFSSYRKSDNNAFMGSIDWNLNYKKSFKKEGQELEVSYSSSFGKPKGNYIQTQTINGNDEPYAGLSGNNPGTDNETNISIDYVHPVNDNITIETGAKTVQQHIQAISDVSFLNTTTNDYVQDPLQSYHLNYDMAIYAGYVSAGFKLFRWLNIRAGARAEHTDLKIDFPGTHIPSYDLVVPSLILSHKFKKDQTLKIAYTRRIERPDYSELNPFMNLSDPRNITTGNPALKPEIGDNTELGYSKTFENGGNIYIALVERINSQDLKQITTFYPEYMINDSVYTNVSVSTRQNIGKEYNSGGIITGSFPVTEKLNLRGNFMATNRFIVSTLYVGDLNMGMRYRLNLNLSYQLPKDLVIEAFGNYNSAALNIQGKNPQSITYTFAFRKQFLNKKASLGLTATNPFNKYIKQETTIVTGTYTSYNLRSLPYRSFGISFTYKFGKMEFEKNKEENEYLNVPPPSN
jgi:ferric enterobactin receptor